MSSLRAGVGSATPRSCLASTARRAVPLLRALPSPPRRWQATTSMSTPMPMLRRPFVVVAASSSSSDDGTQHEGFVPSGPQQSPEERRLSTGSNAVAIPWYYLTPARTFLAASSLKLISFTMTTTVFATALLPFGFWQSACAVAAGACLALLAKRLEAEKFVEKASRFQWFALVASVLLSAVVFSMVVPGRSNISYSGALDVSPRSSRTINAPSGFSSSSSSPSSSSSKTSSKTSSSSNSPLPPAPVRSSSSLPLTRADADKALREMMRVEGRQGARR